MKKRKGSGMGYQSQPTHGPQYPWFLFIPFIRFKGFTAIHQKNRTSWEKPWKSYCRVPLSRSKHCKCMFRCWGQQAMESQEFKEHFSVETTSRVLKGVVENSFYFLVNILEIPCWYGDMVCLALALAPSCTLLTFLMPLYHALKILSPPKMWLKGRVF